ncbi:MAG: hypothetical protein IJ091_00505, partial [Oscillospiraceae bacterium]|nr:hypothetical protein [Oscillospiraceae bacterium]
LPIASSLSFSIPRKIILSKMGSHKKRFVYSYDEDETWVLKHLAFLLYKYDDKISDNCYSFRRNTTAKTAFDRIMRIDNLEKKYILKLDIHDYFNSIDTFLLLKILKCIFEDDEQLYEFVSDLLNQDKCVYEGKIIGEKRGVMAGVPLASFMANVYLSSLDELFQNRHYFRYSDDILIISDTYEEMIDDYKRVKDHLSEKKLTVNKEKTAYITPHEPFSFLGFECHEGNIDLSPATIEKMKGKIRRKAHKLYMWRTRNNQDYAKAARAMIRSFDNKFYDLSGNNDFTWSRFYFPVITVTDGLHEIDEYMLEHLRYLYSGRHYKGNYAISYEFLKKLGYTPLVSEYYNWKEENRQLYLSNTY